MGSCYRPYQFPESGHNFFIATDFPNIVTSEVNKSDPSDAVITVLRWTPLSEFWLLHCNMYHEEIIYDLEWYRFVSPRLLLMADD